MEVFLGGAGGPFGVLGFYRLIGLSPAFAKALKAPYTKHSLNPNPCDPHKP